MNSLIKNVCKSVIMQSFVIGVVGLIFVSTTLLVSGQRRASVSSMAAGKASRKEREREEKRLEKIREKEQKTINKKNVGIDPNRQITGQKITAEKAFEKTTSDITREQIQRGNEKTTREILAERGIFPEREGPDRQNLPQNPLARSESRFPYPVKGDKSDVVSTPSAPQSIGKNFDTVTGPTETGAFPPDTMGAVGPSQFVVFLNGRIRTFNKVSGTADGVMNVDADVFFAPVVTPVGGAVVASFTSDPNVRYDRLSGRWFLTIIDVPCTNASCSTTAANRILIAVSDAGSSSAITGSTVWTFYQFQGDAANFTDYPSLGIDANALYIGGNMFTPAGAFAGTDGWVVPKAPALSGGPLTVWHFVGFASGAGAGPFAPRGVDNVDPNNTGPAATGYFIGVDNAAFSLLQIRRITDPSNTAVSPTVSANISLTVPTTTSGNRVTHLGNTGGAAGGLDSLDDRLYAAVLKNGRLWTAHNFRVSAAGVANTAAQARNAIRWYELQNLNTTPALVQSGTIFDNAATLAAAQQYWIPSITVSGQGHAALGGSTAGTAFRINAITTGRLVGDTLGTMRDGPGQIGNYSGNTTFAYNPASDPGGTSGRRWGDYSFTSLDPLDDMTIWTVQEYNNGTNTYGARVAQLLAPPPATVAPGPNAGLYNVTAGMASVNVTITGTSVSGSGWFDPGANLAAPALPFNHLTASVSGANVTVNSVTYNSPTSITLNLNTVGATLTNGPNSPATVRDLTITNPDGQSLTAAGIINILQPTAATATISGRALTSKGQGIGGVQVTVVNTSTQEKQTVITNPFGNFTVTGLPSGNGYIILAQHKQYSFSNNSQLVNLTSDASITFVAN